MSARKESRSLRKTHREESGNYEGPWLFSQQCSADADQRCSSLRRRPLQNAADEFALEHEALESIEVEWPVSWLLWMTTKGGRWGQIVKIGVGES